MSLRQEAARVNAAHGPREVPHTIAAAMSLPDLSSLGRRPTPTQYFLDFSFDSDNPRPLNTQKIDDPIWVEPDGACLFHALKACCDQAKPWLDSSTFYANAQEMRLAVCAYIQNRQQDFRIHEDTFKELLSRHSTLNEGEGQNLTYSDMVGNYVRVMRRPDMWGGYPEIDAAAMMLGVIISVFIVPPNEDTFSSAVLAARFFPTEMALKDQNARLEVPKFVLIVKGGHYWYVPPRPPSRRSSGQQEAGASNATTVSVDDVKRYMASRHPKRGQITSPNAQLKDAEQQRVARQSKSYSRNGQPGSSCAVDPVVPEGALTKEEIERMDAELARREQQRHDEDYQRSQSDRLLALRLTEM